MGWPQDHGHSLQSRFSWRRFNDSGRLFIDRLIARLREGVSRAQKRSDQ
jgi:hypothetical protein